jgi:hypothetical protein
VWAQKVVAAIGLGSALVWWFRGRKRGGSEKEQEKGDWEGRRGNRL